MSAPVRLRYLTDTIATASPARLLVMLYDRLCLDLERAHAALLAGEREPASDALVHAQDILMELRGSLRLDGWDGAANLSGIYTFLIGELLKANIRQEPDRVSACLATVRPLRDTWREALGSNPHAPAELRALA
ncbi:MAG TPA: flagellar export chaperone FliS [Actinophytocola sp.]|uniref:flagellar export chaperone FliS n=1 Tax=Actinophytocola sp. TaxID=1872138 RepID=UPI002DBB3975|nr:flagellar export chaperone FliS [Actinophytocola sp.]HEU5474205.1 flagellar export chaperone FliS [Actinophytocola sp.]